MNETVWAFDLGKASIGEAVRQGNKFLHKASLLIPEKFAETKPAAVRRRMWRTRLAHKAREAWLDEVMRAAGIEPLRGRRVTWNEQSKKWDVTPGDEKLEREFAPAGDDTCYTSCLLRIKLLRGETLEPWQIYKALHSAIQRRGYGRVPWASREQKRAGKTEEQIEKELAKKDPAYKAAVEAWPKFKESIRNHKFHFPCYYDALKMGLWNPADPDAINSRITYEAQSTCRVRFDRADVEAEIVSLGRQAAEQLPQIRNAFDGIKAKGWTRRDKKTGREARFRVAAADFGEFLVYGPAGAPSPDETADFNRYLKFRTGRGLHPGTTDDWMGATAQKVPRFDNRIINGCALLPPDRFQVCKAEPRLDAKTGRAYPDSLLHCEVVCLMKLKNLRVQKNGAQRKLLPDELRTIFNKLRADALSVKPDAKDWPQKVADRFAIIESEWGSKKGFAQLGLRPLPGQEEVKAPNVGGRSRYSRPALRLMRALILGGQKPSEFKARLLAKDANLLGELGLDLRDTPAPPRVRVGGKPEPQRRPYLLPGDVCFLNDLIKTGDVWENLHFPEQRLDALEMKHTDAEGLLDRDAAIREVLGSINDPVVRHRLEVFSKRLRALCSGSKANPPFGVPDRIVLEFVRTDFMGEVAKAKLKRFQDDRETARKEARAEMLKLGIEGRSAGLRYQLWKAQGCICLYTGKPLHETDLADYEIDHIVPQSLGGPDAQINYVLTFHDINNTKEKGKLTPFALLHSKDGWDAYVERVEARAGMLRNKKVQLLIREDAAELVERYTALAETAWISRLAQKIASLQFGWRNGIDYGGKQTKQRVIAISGGLTARVRRKYHLNSILAPCPPGENPIEWEEKAEKNRDDDRHHALDAMVISFLESWVRNPSKEQWFRFPPEIHQNAKAFFAANIKDVAPEPLAAERPTLEEKFYGLRTTLVGKQKKPVQVPARRLERIEDLPYKTENMKRVFDASFKTAMKRVENIRDPNIQAMFQRVFNEQRPDEKAWTKLCEQGFFQTSRDGRKGSRIRRLMLNRGKLDEYRDMGKGGRPALRRGEPHRGQWIYWDTKNELCVRPVYAHESPAKVRSEIAPAGSGARIVAFVFSGCLIETTAPIPREEVRLVVLNEEKKKRRIEAPNDLPPARYILRQVVTDSKAAELDTPDGKRIMTQVDQLVKAGLRFVRTASIGG